MVIYLDIIFLENLCMNYIILLATSKITKVEIKYIRILLSSIVGGAYAIVSMMNIFMIYSNFLLKIILSIVMVYIALNPPNVKNLIKQLLIFYLISFTFGGVAFALLYFVRPQDILMKNGIYIGTYPLKIALLGGIIGFAISIVAFKIIKQKLSKKDMFCDVEIYFNGKNAKLNTLLDTGNFLKEPITGFPVMIAEAEALKQVLPLEIIENIEDFIKGNTSELKIENIEEYISKFRVIPFTSLGNQNGMLLGFKSEYIIINNKTIKNVIIGIYNKKLAKDSSYKALIGLEILERSEKNECITNTKV